MGKGDGRGHQLRGFIAGKAEHHALIAGASLVFVVIGVVDALSNVRALSVDGGHHGAGVAVKAVFRLIVANAADDLAGDGGNVYIAVGGDLPHNEYHAGGGDGLAGDTGVGVLFQNGVQYAVRNLVTDFVGMSFRDRLRGENTFLHFYIHSFQVIYNCMSEKNAPLTGGTRKER